MHNVGALMIAALTLCAIVFDLIIVVGPRFNNNPVGGVFFNTILLAYGLPAVLAITLALIARTTRPMPYRVVAAITAVTLGVVLSDARSAAAVSTARSWPDRPPTPSNTAIRRSGSPSASRCLPVGFFLRSQPARLLALGVIALTVAKVFIVDTASISGIYRALSVIGLGVVLLGIGWLYQRLFYPRGRLPAARRARRRRSALRRTETLYGTPKPARPSRRHTCAASYLYEA